MSMAESQSRRTCVHHLCTAHYYCYDSGVMAQVGRLFIGSSITQTCTIAMDCFLGLDRGINWTGLLASEP
jgi:hypothetical protein